MNTSFSIRYTLAVFDATGRTKSEQSGHNLVMRAGIPQFFRTVSPCARFGAGSGNTNPENRDSGVVTFSNNWTDAASSFQVTASAGFFIASDAGRILKLDTGEEFVISSYASATSVTVSPHPVAPTQAQQGTVWYDNLTGLDSPITEFSNLAFSAAATNTVVVTGAAGSAVATVTRSLTSAASAAAYTLREIGWFTAGLVMVGRARLATPIPLLPGDYIQCTLTATYQIDCTAKVISMPGTYGDFSGTTRFYGASATGFSSLILNASGGSPVVSCGPTVLDLSVIHATEPSPTVSKFGAATITSVASPLPSVCIERWSGSVSGGAATINFLTLGIDSAGYASQWIHALSAPFSKANLQTVSIAFDFKLTRILVN